ncbi:MAG TPA: DUF3352 domain-containing protein [Candidatus Limnocylindrales bacterium]|nr:DUF3352 domain-containing protein [Candidatus Limnocylindrales bacterium]
MTEPTIEELEPTSTPPGSSPATVSRPAGRFGIRWAIALVVVALVASASVAGAWFLAGQSGAATLAGWMPADTVAYAEVRLDLPGDQRQQLGNFLAHFPGFADQSILDDKLAETWDRLLREATDGKHDFSSEIRPWFGGEIAGGVASLPEPSAGGQVPHDASGLVAVASKDDAAALAWLKKVSTEKSGSVRTESYAGGDLLVDDHGAAAVRDGALLLGDVTSVKSAIDRGPSGGLPAVDRFRAAVANVDDSRLGLVYVDLRRYVDWALALVKSAAPTVPPALVEDVPDWFAGSLRADGDALTIRAAMPHTAAAAASSNAASTLSSRIPASALAVIDQNDLGASLRKAIDTARTSAGSAGADTFAQLDQAVGLLGGWDGALGWVGETAFVVDHDGSTPTGGVLIAPKDQAAASRLASQVRGFIGLAGASAGITSRDEQHAGTTVTIIGLPQAAGSPLPEVAFALTDGLAAIGPTAWVERVLDTDQASSLAADARFSAALGRVDANHVGLAYANLAGIRELVESAAPASADERALYDREVKPYLLPFDTVISTSTVAGDVDRVHSVVIVK